MMPSRPHPRKVFQYLLTVPPVKILWRKYFGQRQGAWFLAEPPNPDYRGQLVLTHVPSAVRFPKPGHYFRGQDGEPVYYEQFHWGYRLKEDEHPLAVLAQF